MKKCYCFMVLFMASACFGKTPDAGRVGIGVMIGDPIGPTLKLWLAPTQALNFAVGFGENISAIADYEWHSWTVFPRPTSGNLSGYLGLGAKLEDQNPDHSLFGIRTKGGISYWLAAQPIELFLEAGPVFELSPHSDVNFDGGAGLRYYFGGKR